ncbi:hypothetical protein [uncultured Roseobacter sp.]|uniref:hypothetical protein n=1 Tax=uncultured Roseobacter sp. TaxID=114847 RepID=UPI00262A0517|nr:hypothetical protein [uncultured Roseobacter sp.]
MFASNHENLGKTLSDLGSHLSAPARRTRIWDIFFAGIGNDLTADDRSLSERRAYSEALDPQRLSVALNEWRSALKDLKGFYEDLKQAGETDNAAPMPSDIRNM